MQRERILAGRSTTRVPRVALHRANPSKPQGLMSKDGMSGDFRDHSDFNQLRQFGEVGLENSSKHHSLSETSGKPHF